MRVEPASRRIPEHFVRRLRRASHKLDDGVPLRLQKRRQRPAHQTRGPHDQKPHRPHRNITVGQLHIGLGDRMPVIEQPRQFPAGERRAAEFPQRAERQLVSDLIRQHAGASALGRFDPVQMLPSCERPADLHVAKLHAFDVVAVFHVPVHPDRSDLRAQVDPSAVADSAGMREHFEFLPRRRQPRKRARSFMPGKHLGGRPLDADAARKRG